MSSSRRSPAVAIMPMREIRPRSLGAGLLLGVPLDELAEHPHAGGVVAVVDDDVDVVDVDLVHPAGGEVVGRGERPQPLTDLVQAGAGGEGCPGRGHGVGDVEHRGATEGRRQQVGPGELHGTAAVPDDDHVAPVGGSRTTARPPRRQWSSMSSRTLLTRAAMLNHTPHPSTGGASGARAGRRR
jgi:hypothetical protein